jgi:hypothetical protein
MIEFSFINADAFSLSSSSEVILSCAAAKVIMTKNEFLLLMERLKSGVDTFKISFSKVQGDLNHLIGAQSEGDKLFFFSGKWLALVIDKEVTLDFYETAFAGERICSHCWQIIPAKGANNAVS